MEDLSIVLVCLFCVFFLTAPIIGVFHSRQRASRARAADPGPKEFMRARRKLSTVTVMSNVTRDTGNTQSPDVEATAAQLELGECPICIGPLVPEPALVDGRNIRKALDELTTLAARRRRLPAAASKWKKRRDGQGGAAGGEEGDVEGNDVLTLNSCGHAFHSRCLASWFLIQRYDCPVCRVVYYKRPSLPQRAVARPGAYMGAGGRFIRMG